MALRQYINGDYREVGGLNHRIDGETRPISALYKCVGGMMLPVWEAGNLRTLDGMILQTSDKRIINVTL